MNPKLGFYKVGEKIFFNKLQAILFANETLADVTWNFNDEVFDSVNWLDEPPLSLKTLYEHRARQIREQFDYVILMCSGGADSTNVLYSFLDNNIKVDEIIAGAPLSGLSNWKVNITDTSADNTVSETFMAQLPLLNKVSQSHPEIKITIHDYFEDILKIKTDEWIYESSAHWIHFSGATRHSLDKFHHLRNMAEAGKKIGVVYGIDKPILHRTVTGNLYTIIMDPVVNVVTPHFKDRYPNVESILFYYSPELPELLVKQAKEVAREIYKPENLNAKSYLWDKSKSEEFNGSTERGSRWQRSIIPFIYPGIYSDQGAVWQAEKQGLGFRGGFQIDNWILQTHKDHRVVQMVESDLNLFIKKINMKYISTLDKADGFIRFMKYWKIGHESQFIPI